MNCNFSSASRRLAALTFLMAISDCGGATPIAGPGNTSVGTGGNTLAVHVPDAGESPGSGGSAGARSGMSPGGSGGGAGTTPGGSGGVPGMGGGVAGRGGTTTACVVGAACRQGFGCDQTCRMGGRAGLIACSCGANNAVGCGLCVPGAAPTCLPTVIDGQGCVPGTPPATTCHTACTNRLEALCTCVAGMAGRGGGGAMSGTWRCNESRAACTP